jgi:hypothetical protein
MCGAQWPKGPMAIYYKGAGPQDQSSVNLPDSGGAWWLNITRQNATLKKANHFLLFGHSHAAVPFSVK